MADDDEPLYPGGRPRAWFDNLPATTYAGTGLEPQFNSDLRAARRWYDLNSWRLRPIDNTNTQKPDWYNPDLLPPLDRLQARKVAMADDMSDEDFKSHLATMLEQHAAGVDVPVDVQGTDVQPLRQQPNAGLDILRQLVPTEETSAATQAGQRFTAGHQRPDFTEQLKSLAMDSAGMVPGGAAGGATGLIAKALKNPQTIKKLLAGLGTLLGSTSAAAQKAPAAISNPPAATPVPRTPGTIPEGEGGPTSEDETIMQGLNADITKLKSQIDAEKPSREITTPSGRQIKTGSKLPELNARLKEAEDKKSALQDRIVKRREQFLEDEKPWLEKNGWWYLPLAAGVSGKIAHKLSSREIFHRMNEGGGFPKAWPDQWKQAANYGLLGLAEGPAEFLIPETIDKFGKGRAKEESDLSTAKPWEELGFETLGDMSASLIGGKLGIPSGEKQFLKNAMAKSGGTKDILQQVENMRARDLRATFAPRPAQAPAAAAPPVAAPPAAPREVRYNKFGRPYYPGGGNPTATGVPYRPPTPPTAANPQIPNAKTIPAQRVVPTPDPSKSSPLIGILKMLGGPENR